MSSSWAAGFCCGTRADAVSMAVHEVHEVIGATATTVTFAEAVTPESVCPTLISESFTPTDLAHARWAMQLSGRTWFSSPEAGEQRAA